MNNEQLHIPNLQFIPIIFYGNEFYYIWNMTYIKYSKGLNGYIQGHRKMVVVLIAD